MEEEDTTHIKGYLSKIISDKYTVENNDSDFLNSLIHPNKFRYYTSEISKILKYQNKQSTYGLKFGSNKMSWIMIVSCLSVSFKIFYDIYTDSSKSSNGMILILCFFLFCILFFGYKILFENPVIEIQKDKLIYRKKEQILWTNIVSVGLAINRSGKLLSDKRIIIGTKQSQIKELEVSTLGTSIQEVIDVILINMG